MVKNPEIGNLLQREQLLVFSGLALITVLAWTYMLHMAWEMVGKGMDINLACLGHWGPGDLTHMFIMWSIMMVAMMIPSATPMIIIFTTVNRHRSNNQGPFMPTGLFLLGYLIAWTVYSALATMVQWGLHTAALLTHTLVITSPVLGASLLVAAGVFQWTPFRDACMTRCRSPFGFIMTEWREGHRGALIMGLKHGIYCVGCCWMLMVLSFVLGVMNMFWMAALTAFMVLEKVTGNKWISRIAGMILLVWGLWGIAGAFIMLPHASLRITEVRKSVGDLEAEMRIDRNPPVLGDNNIEIELRDAAGRIITEAKVLVNYYMPPMPRMAPMNYIVDAKLKGDKYRATMNLIMSGPWVIAVKINQDGKISRAKFNVDAQ